jgi:RNA polymerase sigma-70 factor, ECF subfamily
MIIDDAMVAAAREGSVGAFDAIVETYHVRIARYLYRLVGDQEVALDLTQDTFLEAYRGIGRLRSNLALSAWLYRIATNHAVGYRRRHQLISWLPLPGWADAHPERSSSPAADEGCGERECVHRALLSLPRDRAACLLLHAREGFSYEDVGAICGISPEAARKRIARAKEQFKAAYDAQQDGEGRRR